MKSNFNCKFLTCVCELKVPCNVNLNDVHDSTRKMFSYIYIFEYGKYCEKSTPVLFMKKLLPYNK